jgi:hypothetical protein
LQLICPCITLERMDKETLASLEVVMAFSKHHGVDDDNFEDFMAVSDWREPAF